MITMSVQFKKLGYIKKPVKFVEMIFGQSMNEKHVVMHHVMNISS